MDWNQLSYKQKILAVALVISALIAFVLFSVFSKKANNVNVIAADNPIKSANVQSAETGEIYIEVVGHVKFPGVYLVNKNLLVIEALEIAGGLTENADLNFVHKELKLSVSIEPNQKIYIPGKGELKSSLNTTPNQIGKININTATFDQLISIPGIGTVTANKIIENRPYNVIEDIMNVPGIGEGIFNKIVTYIVL